ncbi:carbamoyl phosphate synthase small subunit [Salsuginibacillus kocurii]|uniref:carbamoyl phosphate synthase small subunit n=1 Tax=Salsuginibacillus kocurii TaxID=427078 RepID=UPI000362CD12|nr:carbamoyl phosphate synthase small subunit [Salsuginibacillus kocurii]
MKRALVLEDGSVFIGEAFGAKEGRAGEVVFNTGMTGYQEILSDPSYCDQIVTLTYPLIGNYGINRDDFESIHPSLAGLIVKEAAAAPSHWRSENTLHELLQEKNIPGLAGIDTRRLTKIIRAHGTLKGRFVSLDEDMEVTAAELTTQTFPRDQVCRVSTQGAYHAPGVGPRVVLIDYGAKHGIIRQLIKRGADVYVVPYDMSAKEILSLKPDGIMLSNGPGDPTDVGEAIETVKTLISKLPIFGICLGHQLISLACGATASKLKFGHRGSNHPVKDVRTGRVDITAQNHGYTIDESSLAGTDLSITHVAINDGTVEGVAHKKYPVFSVQYHPEASPGPEDANPLFDRFFEIMEKSETERKELSTNA